MPPSPADSSWASLRDRLNRSGVPFQLAVESFIRANGRKYGFEFIGREVAWEDGFLDILARKEFISLAIECKKVEDETWVFVTHDNGTHSRCRLEWYNPRLPDTLIPTLGHDKVFCSEFNMVENSPESQFCLLPKGGQNKILEPLAADLLAACRDILEDADRAHDKDHWEVIAPVIVTNSQLVTCAFDPRQVDLTTGSIQLEHAAFAKAPFVRFRKTLVAYRSDPVSTTPIELKSWIADRERTVFVVAAEALGNFTHGFRSFYCSDAGGNPKEWNEPVDV